MLYDIGKNTNINLEKLGKYIGNDIHLVEMYTKRKYDDNKNLKCNKLLI